MSVISTNKSIKNQSNVVCIALGSNLGDRNYYLEEAIRLIKEHSIVFNIQRSAIYANKALLKPNSPKDWDLEFLNMVIKGETELEPLELLEKLQRIEQILGRDYKKSWAPREIDLDILIYGEEVIDLPHIKVPHPEMINRDFCLIPLAQLYPEWKYPYSGEYHNVTVKEIVKRFL